MQSAQKKKTHISFFIREENEPRHRSFVNCLAHNPDRGYLFSGGSDSIIRKWDIKTPKLSERYLLSMEHHCDWVNDIVFCNNGSRLVSASNDTLIKVWDTKKGICISSLKPHNDSVRCLTYAANPREMIVSAGLDKSIFIWDVETLTKITNINNVVTTASLRGSKSSIYSLALNANGSIVLAGSPENVIRIWDPRTCDKVAKLRGHTDNIRAIVVDRDGKMCLSASSDGTVRLWSIGQQRCIGSIRCHSDSVWSLQTDSNFSYVVSGGRDQRCFKTPLRNLSDCKLMFVDEKPIQKVLLEETNDGLHCWTATWSSTIRRWPLSPMKNGGLNDSNLKQMNGESPVQPNMVLKGAPSVRKCVILNDKRHIVTKDTDENVEMWDVLQARKVKNYGKVNIEDVIKTHSQKMFVPSWFSVDAKCGFLEITLEESDVFSAWVSAKDANFTDKPNEAKLNYGGMMLKSLFERWVYSFNDSTEDSPIRGFYSIPSHTPFSVWAYSEEFTFKPIVRCTAYETEFKNESLMLRETLPTWVLDVVQMNQFPRFNKIPFLLQPHSSFPSKIGTIKKDRLSATEMLLIRKVMEHVYEKILYPSEGVEGSEGGEQHGAAGSHQQQAMSTQQIPPNIEEKIELFCNDQKLDPDMDLRTVKHFIWKQSSDLIIQYRPVR